MAHRHSVHKRAMGGRKNAMKGRPNYTAPGSDRVAGEGRSEKEEFGRGGVAVGRAHGGRAKPRADRRAAGGSVWSKAAHGLRGSRGHAGTPNAGGSSEHKHGGRKYAAGGKVQGKDAGGAVTPKKEGGPVAKKDGGPVAAKAKGGKVGKFAGGGKTECPPMKEEDDGGDDEEEGYAHGGRTEDESEIRGQMEASPLGGHGEDWGEMPRRSERPHRRESSAVGSWREDAGEAKRGGRMHGMHKDKRGMHYVGGKGKHKKGGGHIDVYETHGGTHHWKDDDHHKKEGGRHWMKEAFAGSHGQFKAKAKKAGMSTSKFASKEAASPTASTKTKRQANLAKIGMEYGKH